MPDTQQVPVPSAYQGRPQGRPQNGPRPSYGPHEHEWQGVAIQPSPREASVTIALIVCGRCHEPRSVPLIGVWDLDQVRGAAAAPA